MPISRVNTSAAQPLISAERASETSKAQKPEEETQGHPSRPVTDQYIPKEEHPPFGRYWMGKDEDGQPKIYFDDPERAEENPQKPESTPDVDGSEKGDRKEEKWACDTGKVDREIEKLKEKKQELEQRLKAETDGTKLRELERQLAQVEQGLGQKDNDAYRKQHATFTRLL